MLEFKKFFIIEGTDCYYLEIEYMFEGVKYEGYIDTCINIASLPGIESIYSPAEVMEELENQVFLQEKEIEMVADIFVRSTLD